MPEFLTALNPGWLLIAAGLAAMLISVRQVRQAIALIAPIAGILLLASAQHGVDHLTFNALGIDLSF